MDGGGCINCPSTIWTEEGGYSDEVVMEGGVGDKIAGIVVCFRGEGKKTAGRGCEGGIVWEGEGEGGHSGGSE